MINNLKYHIETYGCQMNVYDSELISGLLIKEGGVPTKDIEAADVVFLNTCSIREKAEETVFNRLNYLKSLKKKNPKMLLGLIGCMAQNLKNDLLESNPYVDIILGPDSYRRIPDIIRARESSSSHNVDTKLSKYEVYEDIFPSRNSGVNAWISISRGCDKFCTFCIVPFTRGRERSKSMDSIINEAKNAVKCGFVEITLLGQNVNSYRTSKGTFSDLLAQVANIKGLKRIRYTSPHPKDMDDELLKVMVKFDNICNSIHLPLQSGSDRILKRMNRTYNSSDFLALVHKIRRYIPSCSISTDIIVGFPGESNDDFLQTLKIVKEVQFDNAFMFKYSPRPGTKAVEYTDQISEELKQNRLEKLISLQKENSLRSNTHKIGKYFDVLIEKESKKSSNQWSGRTEGNTWVVFDKGSESIGDIVKIFIHDAKGVTLFGRHIQNKEVVA